MSIFSGLIIQHPRYERALEDALASIALCQGKGGIIPILGPTRIGKSEIVNQLDQQVGELRQGPGTLFIHRDFAKSTIGPQPNHLELYTSMGKALEVEIKPTWRLQQTKRWLFEIIRKRGVRYIALDECSHCAEPGARLSRRAAGNHWKHIVDETGITLILTGLPKFQALIDENEQFRDRCVNTILLEPYRWSDEEDNRHFGNTVLSIFDFLKSKGLNVDFKENDMIRRLYAVSGGRIGRVMGLLEDALKFSSETMSLSFDDVAKCAARGMQRMRNLPDIFGEEAPADAVLIKSYNSIMSEAGLSVPLETSADLAAVQSIQRGPKVA